MYLSRFGVKNYKCLGEIDIPLTPIHVLIGQNDCGKTSLLEAMEAFYSTLPGKMPVFSPPWDGRELVRQESEEPFFNVWADFNGSVCDKCPGSSNVRHGFAVKFGSSGNSFSLENVWVELNGKKYDYTHTTWGQFEDQRRVVFKGVNASHKYALNAQAMSLPAAYDENRKFRLDSDGFGLATLLGDILEYSPESFLQLREEFCFYFPQFKTVRIATESAIERHLILNGLPHSNLSTGKGIYLVSQAGEEIRAHHASDGAILFLGLLALAHLPEPPGLLLLEEPENGVYPTRLGQIIKLLKDMVTRTDGVRFPQIIMTTHSPYVLSFFEPEEVTFLSRPSEPADAPVRARPLRDAPNIRERLGSEFYLGELWYNLSEEELFGDA